MPTKAKPFFHAFTIKYQGIVNRIVTELALTPAYDNTQYAEPPFPLHKTTALWDTGATASLVTASTAKAMGLVPVGNVPINHAGGTSNANTYVTTFFLPNRVFVPGVMVTECQNNAGAFGAIIGMDIIAQGDFSITNRDGHTWMSFRIPSTREIDYVLEAHQLNFAGVGRNAPCPCGKRDARGNPVKFKHCHANELSPK